MAVLSFLAGVICPLSFGQKAAPGPQRIRLPLSIEENRGQAGSAPLYVARAKGHVVAFSRDALALTLVQGDPRTETGRAARVEMRWRDGLPGAIVEAEEPLPGVVNYYLGDDPAKWLTGLATYSRVRYRSVYPGIDMVAYGTSNGELEYDFVVAPGADPAKIRLDWSGVSGSTLDANGDLVFSTAAGPLRCKSPTVYQDGASGRVEVRARYRPDPRGGFGFEVADYDRTKALIIDPVLLFSTFVGGGNSEPFNGTEVGPDGSIYMTGVTYSFNYPVTGNATDSTLGGLYDAKLTKINATGTTVLFSTYIGGTSNDGGNAVAIDSAGAAYLTGFTVSSNFPSTASAFQRFYGGGASDGFVVKIATNTGTLVYSTFMGGSGHDNGLDIEVNSDLQAVVALVTDSANFPTTTGAFDRTFNGGWDAAVISLRADGTGLNYGTYFGGSGDESVQFTNTFENRQIFSLYGPSLKLDTTGAIYLAGVTTSTNLPTTAGAFSTSYRGGNADGWFAKLTSQGLQFCSYLGGNEFDAIFVSAVTVGGAMYVSGVTSSANYSTTDGAFDRTYNGGPRDAVMSLVNTTGSGLLFSTYFGTEGDDFGGIGAVDGASRLYFIGTTSSSAFPTTSDAYDATFNGGIEDVVVCVFESFASSLVYSTYFGGTSTDENGTIRLDPDGNIVFSGTTFSSSFPVTPGAYDRTYNGGNADGFIAKFAPFGTTGGIPSNGEQVLPPIGSLNGQLNQGSGISSRRSSYVVRVPFIGKAGQQISISLTSNDFDTYLFLIGPNESVLTQDDDSGIGTNSRIPTLGNYTLPATGRYVIEVASFGSFAEGSFTLSLTTILPSESVGTVQSGLWIQDRNGNQTWDGTVTDRLAIWTLGQAGEIPVAGDWNGNGKTKIGLYHNGTWLLDYNGNGLYDGPVIDRLLYFGGPGYTPVVGDWAGRGYDTVAVHQNGTWLIDLSGNFQWDGILVDRFIFFGGPGFTPYIGDWNGSGSSKLAVHNNGTWLIDFNGNFQWDGADIDKLLFFGGGSFVPVVGDWNGSGTTKIGGHSGGTWIVDFNGNFQWDGPVLDRLVFFGGPGFTPVVGDWNATGTQKLGAYQNGTWILDFNGSFGWDGLAIDKLVFFGGVGQTPRPGRW